MKIYGIDTSLYNRLVPFIYLDKKSNDKGQRKNNRNSIDINRTGALLLRKEAGIDSSLSETIIKYRNLLGGFYDKTQFREIYGIDEKQINILNRTVFIDTTLIRKININTSDFKILEKHPYINIYQSNAILKYRNYKGDIPELTELVKNNILPRNNFLKIRPYLSTE